MATEKVPYTDSFPVGIYRPKAGTVPDGWFLLGHTADSSQALIVKPTLPAKSGRNIAVTGGSLAPGMVHSGYDHVPAIDLHTSPHTGYTTQPSPNLPEYKFLSTYFLGFSSSVAPDKYFGALRPGLFLEGRWELVSTYNTAGLFEHSRLTRAVVHRLGLTFVPLCTSR